MKYAKVIVTAKNLNRFERKLVPYPHHQQWPISTYEQEKIWDIIRHIEQTVDGGMDFDSVIICNGIDAFLWWKKYDGEKTANGVFRVIGRTNDWGSFGGYSHAYQFTDYDAFLFTEDDILIWGERYYARIVEEFNAQDNAGFLGLIGVSKNPNWTHCHGGVGYTTREIMKCNEDENGELPHPQKRGWDQSRAVRYGEYPFTHNLVTKGYDLVGLRWHERVWDKKNLCKPYWCLTKDDYNDFGYESD